MKTYRLKPETRKLLERAKKDAERPMILSLENPDESNVKYSEGGVYSCQTFDTSNIEPY
jgi:hypothetical protein